MEPDPTKLELGYIQNEGLNFLASQETNSAMEKIREKLANKITSEYTSQVFASLVLSTCFLFEKLLIV